MTDDTLFLKIAWPGPAAPWATDWLDDDVVSAAVWLVAETLLI
ncbi:MAG: hypothetical protein M5U34_07115 [Chloroflexi bacterium]|nr:hypothetical protein [Chloroflexota bacterium]